MSWASGRSPRDVGHREGLRTRKREGGEDAKVTRVWPMPGFPVFIRRRAAFDLPRRAPRDERTAERAEDAERQRAGEWEHWTESGRMSTGEREGVAEAQPGDLLLFYGGCRLGWWIERATRSPFYHVALYDGEGCVVDAVPRGIV